MKGLLIKDMELTLFSKKNLVIFLFIGVFFLFMTEGVSGKIMAIVFISIMFGMMTLTTISYDEFDHSNAFLMTMPITRREYVVEKYLFALISSFCGWLVMLILSSIILASKDPVSLSMEWYAGCLASFAIVYILTSVMIPLQLKFGSDNGRMVMFAIIMSAYVVAFGIVWLLKKLNIDEAVINNAISSIFNFPPALLISGTVLCLLAVVGITMKISINIMLNKQF